MWGTVNNGCGLSSTCSRSCSSYVNTRTRAKRAIILKSATIAQLCGWAMWRSSGHPDGAYPIELATAIAYMTLSPHQTLHMCTSRLIGSISRLTLRSPRWGSLIVMSVCEVEGRPLSNECDFSHPQMPTVLINFWEEGGGVEIDAHKV